MAKQKDRGVLINQLDQPQFKSCASCEHWWPQRSSNMVAVSHVTCRKLRVSLLPSIPKPAQLVEALSLRCCVVYQHNPFVGPSPGQSDDDSYLIS